MYLAVCHVGSLRRSILRNMGKTNAACQVAVLGVDDEVGGLPYAYDRCFCSLGSWVFVITLDYPSLHGRLEGFWHVGIQGHRQKCLFHWIACDVQFPFCYQELERRRLGVLLKRSWLPSLVGSKEMGSQIPI